MNDIIGKLRVLRSEIEIRCNKMTYSQGSRCSRAVDSIESAIDILKD